MTKKKKRERMRKVVHVNFLAGEYDELLKRYEQTNCRSFSEYLRNVTMAGPITVKTRNESMDDFLEVAIDIKNELHGVLQGNDQIEIKMTVEKICELMLKIYRTCTPK